MRSRSLVLLLALTGTALSGCASGFDEAYTQSSIPGQPGSSNNGTDTGGDGISGDTSGTGTSNGVTLSSGNPTLAYVDGARSIDGSGKAQLIVSTTGQSAQVSIDPNVDMGFVGTQTLAKYLDQTGAQTAPVNFDSPLQPNYYPFNNTNYTEYRRITATTDSELQVWNFTTSDGQSHYAAHFRDTTQDQDGWFYGGDGATDSTQIDTLTANNTTVNYAGNYAGAAKATGWGEASNYQTGDGLWRFNGTANVTAHFGTGNFNGTLTPRYWEKFEDGVLIQVDVGTSPAEVVVPEAGVNRRQPALFGDVKDFHTATIELSGTITGNRVTGDANIVTTDGTVAHSAAGTTITNNRFVNGERALQAGFFGNNAEQVTGVFATYGVLPTPTGADTGINDDGRGIIDLQGVFHGR